MVKKKIKKKSTLEMAGSALFYISISYTTTVGCKNLQLVPNNDSNVSMLL